MIKRILVALDPDADTPVAIRHAIELALHHAAEVTGLAVIDARYRGGGGGIGTMYYQEKLRQRDIEESREAARDLITRFEVEMQGSSVPYRTLTEEGVPFERIAENMRYYDLLVVGRGTHFSYSHPAHDTHTVEHVVKRAAAATLVVDTPYRPIRRVLAAYDGSPAAALALQRFAQLKLFGTDPVFHLLNVHEGDRAESERMLQRVAEYLEAHGFRVNDISVLAGSPNDLIISYAKEHEVDLIVMGARFVSRIKERMLGSTTSAVLEQAPASLFLEA